MGDYILMKTLYITLFFLLTQHLYANELTWVDEQVEAIKPPRIGISDKEIDKIKDPFIFLVKEDKKVLKSTKKSSKRIYKRSHFVKKHYGKKLHLEAILNKSALINQRWYKEGQWVYGYKLIKVNRTSVVLQKQNKKLLLTTVSRSKNLKFHNK